jgi:hypothetical protein
MRHRVIDDVDGERIVLLLRERPEEPRIGTLLLPAVTVVAIVAQENHHPTLVVVDGAKMRIAGVAPDVIVLPGDAGVLGPDRPVNVAVEGCAEVRELLTGIALSRPVVGRVIAQVLGLYRDPYPGFTARDFH